MPFPFLGAVHMYFVTTYQQIVTRIEVIGNERSDHPAREQNELFKNYLGPTDGFRLVTEMSGLRVGARFPVSLCATIEGTEGSPAHKLYQLLTSNLIYQYPGFGKYQLLFGANSNTFAQWVINQVPECGFTLPWNAWGKGYQWT